MLRTAVADGDRGTAQTIPYAKQLIAEGTLAELARASGRGTANLEELFLAMVEQDVHPGIAAE